MLARTRSGRDRSDARNRITFRRRRTRNSNAEGVETGRQIAQRESGIVIKRIEVLHSQRVYVLAWRNGHVDRPSDDSDA